MDIYDYLMIACFGVLIGELAAKYIRRPKYYYVSGYLWQKGSPYVPFSFFVFVNKDSGYLNIEKIKDAICSHVKREEGIDTHFIMMSYKRVSRKEYEMLTKISTKEKSEEK